ncbi:hypothetical protein RhiirC2_847515 [Rhizophagus irregularis]|uniref:ATP-dependent DNA helicase n=1 Tax=Rhizophagus irregularis TaxID=588596 RepID=A0A2N1NI83_9GLOM|nr:hypothetical protein RhiirC2_847515 [Rhizophagus irregularis]
MGTAGTGKSYLIMAIRNMLHEMAGNETKTPLLVLAPTGLSAFNIRGRTVHSALSIPICNSNNKWGTIKTVTAKQYLGCALEDLLFSPFSSNESNFVKGWKVNFNVIRVIRVEVYC